MVKEGEEKVISAIKDINSKLDKKAEDLKDKATSLGNRLAEMVPGDVKEMVNEGEEKITSAVKDINSKLDKEAEDLKDKATSLGNRLEDMASKEVKEKEKTILNVLPFPDNQSKP